MTLLCAENICVAYGARGVPDEFRGHVVLQKPFGPVELRRALMDLSALAAQ
jgi:hypothetical protein